MSVNYKLETKASPPRQCSTGRILSRAYAAIREWSDLDLVLLTLKVMSESRVTWAVPLPILVFLGLSFLDLGSMYATDRQTDRQTDRRQTDRQTDVRQKHRLMPPPIRGGA